MVNTPPSICTSSLKLSPDGDGDLRPHCAVDQGTRFMRGEVRDFPIRKAYQLGNRKWDILKGIFQKHKKIPSEALILDAGKQGAVGTQRLFSGDTLPRAVTSQHGQEHTPSP